MSAFCPSCGASWAEIGDCRTIFESLLALEFTRPAHGKVHFLTVACFMIQHGLYSDEGLVWIRSMLQAYFDQALTPEQLRQLAARDTGNDVRTWKVNRAPDARPLPRINWHVTIADVALGYEDAESYCEWVRRWGRAVLQEMAPLLPE